MLLKPVLMLMVISRYHEVIQGQEPDPVWSERLTGMSDKFREMGQKAKDFINNPNPQPNEVKADAV